MLSKGLMNVLSDVYGNFPDAELKNNPCTRV
jgi:hypothetical protein